jgi:hypothetical protein
MTTTRLQIKKEKEELRQEIFDLRHPRNIRGQFVSRYDAPKNLNYWKKQWGRKYGITTSEQGEAVMAMELGALPSKFASRFRRASNYACRFWDCYFIAI